MEGIGACGNCHTPKGPRGDLPGKHLAGGFEIAGDFGVAVASNITSDRATGNTVARSRYIVPMPPSWGPAPPMNPVPDVPTDNPVRYGSYLAGAVAHCLDCHTPRFPDGRFDLSKLGAGGSVFRGPWGVSHAANITPDPETGLGTWTDSEIVASIHGARRGGGRVLPPMPVDNCVKGISESDLKALVAYLRSLPARRNAVPAPQLPR